MLALDALFTGLDPQAYRNLARLLLPPAPRRAGAAPAPDRRLPLVLFVEGGQVVQYLRPGPRPTPAEHDQTLAALRAGYRGPTSLRALQKQMGARGVAVVEDDGLYQLAQAVESRLRPGDDLLTQGLRVAEGIKGLLGQKLHVHPNPLQLGVPRPDQALRAADLLLPDDRSFVLYIVDSRGETGPPAERGRPRVWTSLVLGKRRGAIHHVTTHLGLGLTAPSGDLRRDAKQLGQAAAARISPPHLGVYITLAAWRQVVGPQPGALARAVALGDAVLDPLPTWLLAVTGLGAATGLAEGAGKLLGRFLPRGVVDLAKQVGMSPFQVIGIDPMELWGRITGLARGEE